MIFGRAGMENPWDICHLISRRLIPVFCPFQKVTQEASSMAHHLIVFGFGWILVASIMGMVLGLAREKRIIELEQLAAQNSLVDLVKKDWEYSWSKSRHAHSILFAILCIVVGFALDQVDPQSTTLVTVITTLMLAAVVIWTLASIRHVVPLMGIADFMIFAAVLLTGWLMFVELPGHDHGSAQNQPAGAVVDSIP
jgi:hypothetical protein